MNLYTILKHSHSGWRYVVLLLIVAVLIKSVMGWQGRKAFTSTDDRLSLFLFIATHIQLLLGLVLYFVSPYVRFESGVMADSLSRYWTVEHFVANIIAVVLISLGRIRAKKMTEGVAKHRQLFIWTAAATVLLIISLSAPQAPGVFGMSMGAGR